MTTTSLNHPVPETVPRGLPTVDAIRAALNPQPERPSLADEIFGGRS